MSPKHEKHKRISCIFALSTFKQPTKVKRIGLKFKNLHFDEKWKVHNWVNGAEMTMLQGTLAKLSLLASVSQIVGSGLV